MPSPFPGMDLYLEDPAFWGDFHDSFAVECRNALNAILPDNFDARIRERQTLLDLKEVPPRLTIPDVAVSQGHPLASSVATAHPKLAVEPIAVELQLLEETGEAYIEILQRPERTVIAVVELLSPSNKSGADRRLYLLKRNAILRQPIHLIEIDLLLGGTRVPMGQPLPRGDYYAIVSRAGERTHSEVYAWALDYALPSIRFPLTEPHPDLVLDLQAIFTRTYDVGCYRRVLNYRSTPPLTLTEPVRRWIDNVLQPLHDAPTS